MADEKIPEGFTNRTWSQVENQYGTWGALEGLKWYTVQFGYVYTPPILGDVIASPGIVGRTFTVTADISDGVTAEDGSGFIKNEEGFSGDVLITFLGVQHTMTYNSDTGLFELVIPAPTLEQWQADGPLFSYSLAAANAYGNVSGQYQVTIHRATPVILSATAAECNVNAQTILQVELGVTTTPYLESAEFAGDASATLQGVEYPLEKNVATGLWEASLTSPGETSWNLEGHVYTGSISASYAQETAAGSFSFRVREITPPTVVNTAPVSSIFICNGCAPQFLWEVSDAESGVASAVAWVDSQAPEPADIFRGVARWQPPVLGPGAHQVTVLVTDNDGNQTAAARSLDGLWLITDRSQADVDLWRALRESQLAGRSAAEENSWSAGLKGSYNNTDLNRVETAVGYLVQRLDNLEIHLDLNTVTSWSKSDDPVADASTRYLDNVTAITGTYPALVVMASKAMGRFPEELPTLPEEMIGLDFAGANAIEKALVVIEMMVDLVEAYDWYSTCHTRTWGDVESAYPTWGSFEADQATWSDVAVDAGELPTFVLPWEKHTA